MRSKLILILLVFPFILIPIAQTSVSKGAEPERSQIEISREVRKNVEKFIGDVIKAPDSWSLQELYKEFVTLVWQEKDPEVLDQYLAAFREYPWPKARYSLDNFPSDLAGYCVSYKYDPPGWPESPYHWKIIQWAIEEIERAKRPRIPVSAEVRRNLEEYFNPFKDTVFNYRCARVLDLAVNSGEEVIIKEYAAAIRGQAWPVNCPGPQVTDLGHCYFRLDAEFLLHLLEHPKEREAYFDRLEAKKTGNFQLTPIVRKNVEIYLKGMSELKNERERSNFNFFFWADARLFSSQYWYVKAVKEVPWPEDKQVQQEIQWEIDYAVKEKEIEREHFEMEKMLWVGFPEYRDRARKDVEQFYLDLTQAKSAREGEKVTQKFLDEIAGSGKNLNARLLYEYILAFRYVPQPLFGSPDTAVGNTVPKLDDLLAKAAVEEIERPEFPPEVEEFFKLMASKDILERKKAAFMLLPKLLPYAVIDKSVELMRHIRRHPLPEEPKARKRVEAILKVFGEQEDFFYDRWLEVASPAGKAHMVVDVAGLFSQRFVAVLSMADADLFKGDHWPSIIKDKDRPLIDRFWAAYYLAHYYCDPHFRPEEMDFAELADVITGLTEAVVKEIRGNLEEEVERLRADEDKTIVFLIELALACQERSAKDIKPYVPALLKALESDYLYFRIISQKRLEELTRQQFPLDPTDPAELRAPAIKQWKKWWEENKDKLHYDRMKDQLLQ